MNKTRNSNIELLRIIIMAGVIILHYNNAEIGGGLVYTFSLSVNNIILHFLESMAICAVNVFVLITGYYMCYSDSVSVLKPLKLLVEVILFKLAAVVLTQGLCVVSGMPVDWGAFGKGLLKALIPNNYFVILYIALYCLVPYINVLLNHLSDVQLKKFVFLSGFLFSVWPFGADILSGLTNQEWNGLNTIGFLGDQSGYTIVNFVLMYCVGVYLRRNKAKETSGYMDILKYIGCVIVICLLSYAKADGWTIENCAWEYCNPFVILAAVSLFRIFEKRKEFQNARINRLAGACFTVYLIHTFFIPYIGVQKFVGHIWYIMLAHILVAVPGIYLICFLIDVIYNFFMERIWKILCRVFPVLQKRITCEKELQH